LALNERELEAVETHGYRGDETCAELWGGLRRSALAVRFVSEVLDNLVNESRLGEDGLGAALRRFLGGSRCKLGAKQGDPGYRDQASAKQRYARSESALPGVGRCGEMASP